MQKTSKWAKRDNTDFKNTHKEDMTFKILCAPNNIISYYFKSYTANVVKEQRKIDESIIKM